MTTQLTDDELDAITDDGPRVSYSDRCYKEDVRWFMREAIRQTADRAKQAAPAQDDQTLIREMCKAGHYLYTNQSVKDMRAVLAVVRAHDAAKQAPPEQAAQPLIDDKTLAGIAKFNSGLAALRSEAAQPVAFFYRFHTDDSLAGKPNVRTWQLQEGKPSPRLYEEGEVRLLVDAAPVTPAAPPPEQAAQPVLWVSPGQLEQHDPQRTGMPNYLPAMKVREGNFTMPLYASPPPPAAQAPQALLGAAKALLALKDRMAVLMAGDLSSAAGVEFCNLTEKYGPAWVALRAAIAAASEPEQAHSGDPA